VRFDFGSLSSRMRSTLSGVYRHGLRIPKKAVHRHRALALLRNGFLVDGGDCYRPTVPWYESYRAWMVAPELARVESGHASSSAPVVQQTGTVLLPAQADGLDRAVPAGVLHLATGVDGDRAVGSAVDRGNP
jgi:hypothetical protein